MARRTTDGRRRQLPRPVNLADRNENRKKINLKVINSGEYADDGFTLDREADALADRRRDPVGGDAEIGGHLVAEHAN